jgi:hypothetical protein
VTIRSGREENVPYSLSRWTDLPSGKWPWFKGVLAEGSMFAFSSREALPSLWSLKPEDTLGLNFWTKDPWNLLLDRFLLKAYKVKVHMTITGWEEVEKGAPSLEKALWMLEDTAMGFGAGNVTWRFSPVPLLPPSTVVDRFQKIARTAKGCGVSRVYLAFLQENDLMPEQRTPGERRDLLFRLADQAARFDLQIQLCNDDQALLQGYVLPQNLALGVCAGPDEWDGLPPVESCGCAIMVDPFSINESCNLGCRYCYASDKSLSPKKHNTTRALPVVR